MTAQAKTQPPAPRSLPPSRTRTQRTRQIELYAIMLVLSVLFVFPFFWTVSSSLKTASEVFIFPPLMFPKVPQWGNYVYLWTDFAFGQWILNTVNVVVLSLVGSILSATLVAYSFARFRYRGRDLLFLITLGTMMLPSQVTLIPQYLLFSKLHWLDTIKPLWVPAWFGGGAFNIFLLRQFIMTVPKDLDEAARIDGASSMRILFTVLLPLMMPILATLTVINFIYAWNDFMGPLIYLNSEDKMTISVGLRTLSASSGMGTNWAVPQDHYLMAGCVMTLVPCIAIFFSAQRYFVRGIVMTGLKG